MSPITWGFCLCSIFLKQIFFPTFSATFILTPLSRFNLIITSSTKVSLNRLRYHARCFLQQTAFMVFIYFQVYLPPNTVRLEDRAHMVCIPKYWMHDRFIRNEWTIDRIKEVLGEGVSDPIWIDSNTRSVMSVLQVTLHATRM